jgi:hypothetical protein
MEKNFLSKVLSKRIILPAKKGVGFIYEEALLFSCIGAIACFYSLYRYFTH